MKCQNCGKREANVRYSENINGRKKEYILCEECAEKLGINSKMNFDIPMNFGNLLGGFFEDYNSMPSLLNSITNVKELKCNKCGTTYNDFINTGKFGCENCYSIFSDKLDGVLRNIQGDNIYKGRKGKQIEKEIEFKNNKEENKENSKIDKLKEDLEKAVKDERYEDAAKIRDEIKKLEK